MSFRRKWFLLSCRERADLVCRFGLYNLCSLVAPCRSSQSQGLACYADWWLVELARRATTTTVTFITCHSRSTAVCVLSLRCSKSLRLSRLARRLSSGLNTFLTRLFLACLLSHRPDIASYSSTATPPPPTQIYSSLTLGIRDFLKVLKLKQLSFAEVSDLSCFSLQNFLFLRQNLNEIKINESFNRFDDLVVNF